MPAALRERLESTPRQLILWLGLTSVGLSVLSAFHSPFAGLVLVLAVAGAAGTLLAALAGSDRLALGGLLLAAAGLAIVPLAIDAGLQGPSGSWPDYIGQPNFAAGLLLQGHDPYGHDYLDFAALRGLFLFDLPVHYSFDHFAYAPGMFLLALPEQLLPWPGWRSLGLLAPVAVAVMGAAAYGLGATAAGSRALAAAVLLNPLLSSFYGNLYNDVYALAPALLAILAASRGRNRLAGVLLGLAVVIKQDAVLLAPLVAALALRAGGWRRLLETAGWAAGVAALVAAPFLLWNPRSFVGDTVGFVFGGGLGNSPARGLSLSHLLLVTGVTQNRWENLPFGAAGVALAAAILLAAAADLRRAADAAWPRLWGWTALLAVAVFFTSNVFSSNYLALVLLFLALGAAALSSRPSWLPRFPVLAAALPAAGLLVFGLIANLAADHALSEGLRHPIAVAPAEVATVEGGAGAWTLVMADTEGRQERVAIPGGRYPIALAWSADGNQVAVSMADGLDLYSRSDGTWRSVPLQMVTTIGGDGSIWIAGAWDSGIFRSGDGGRTWERSSVPAGDLQFEQVARSGDRWLMATELGVLASDDGAATWSRSPAPIDRVTSLAVSADQVQATAWGGATAISGDEGRTWTRGPALPAGVWAVAGGGRLVAGATGVFRDGGRVGRFGHHEAVAAGSAGDLDCVSLASGEVDCSRGGGAFSPAVPVG